MKKLNIFYLPFAIVAGMGVCNLSAAASGSGAVDCFEAAIGHEGTAYTLSGERCPYKVNWNQMYLIYDKKDFSGFLVQGQAVLLRTEDHLHQAKLLKVEQLWLPTEQEIALPETISGLNFVLDDLSVSEIENLIEQAIRFKDNTKSRNLLSKYTIKLIEEITKSGLFEYDKIGFRQHFTTFEKYEKQITSGGIQFLVNGFINMHEVSFPNDENTQLILDFLESQKCEVREIISGTEYHKKTFTINGYNKVIKYLEYLLETKNMSCFSVSSDLLNLLHKLLSKTSSNHSYVERIEKWKSLSSDFCRSLSAATP